MYIYKDINFFNRSFKIKSGLLAKNTCSSVLAEIDGTILLVTVVYNKIDVTDFLPLKVDYFERFYANGRIPCNYMKREGKPSEREVLISRLIDRCIRPMFPKNLGFDIQITVTVISINPEINSDIIAINAVVIALSLSDLPFSPITALRIVYKNNIIYINPLSSQVNDCELEMIVAGSLNKISMIEGLFNEIKKSDLIFCMREAIKNLNKIFPTILNFNKYKKISVLPKFNSSNIFSLFKKKYYDVFNRLYLFCDNNDKCFLKLKNNIVDVIFSFTTCPYRRKNFILILDYFLKYVLRKKILFTRIRLDGRKENEIRKISLESNFLPKVHGSSIFSRGETQVLASVTLGTYKDAQLVDCVFFSHYKNNFILHYNFPPYAVNEIGSFSSVKRREIGHGNLAKKALSCVIPHFNDFPYVIRIVSEVLGSNGSSSMATICGSSIALKGAGVPIKSHVAGIALGLIKEDVNYIIMSDINGTEDYIGDMDFKIAATSGGFTALQMDLKIDGLALAVIDDIISKAEENLNFILSCMDRHIIKSQKKLIDTLPKMKILKIDKSKIGSIIGKNGSVIKNLIEKYKSDIDVSDDGIIRISSVSLDNINLLTEEIYSITFDLKLGMIFEGKIIKITQFGAFVNLIYSKTGLLHISKINKYKLHNKCFEIEEGLKIKVEVINIDDGKISLDFA